MNAEQDTKNGIEPGYTTESFHTTATQHSRHTYSVGTHCENREGLFDKCNVARYTKEDLGCTGQPLPYTFRR